MNLKSLIPVLIGAFCIGCGNNSGDQADASGSPAPPAKSPLASGSPAAGGGGYAAVQQIFTASCGCHGASRPKGGIDLSTYESAMKGGDEGPVIKAGDPDASVLVQALNGTNGKQKMPKGGGNLTPEQMKTITDWIKAGAKNG